MALIKQKLTNKGPVRMCRLIMCALIAKAYTTGLVYWQFSFILVLHFLCAVQIVLLPRIYEYMLMIMKSHRKFSFNLLKQKPYIPSRQRAMNFSNLNLESFKLINRYILLVFSNIKIYSLKILPIFQTLYIEGRIL